MAEITVLSKDISELIAAGEVIERPASVIKELVENSIDAGAKHIAVEIKNGGTTYMRITDDGCGIAPVQVPIAFLRHATSKIASKDDLDNILTLGFRGEALASVSAVSKVELLTKQSGAEYGTNYVIAGGKEILNEQSGCPDGTTIIIRDIFFNVPVRRKFMKRDAAEANAVISIMQKIILSHPEISFKLIKDNRIEISSAGDGELYSSVYSVYGRDFAHDMIPVDYSENGISVKGYIIKPLYSKSNRSFQNFFINGRFVKSITCSASLEEAYQNLVMVGKYPACVLMLDVPPMTVDVNVHPAKAEVRFSDEKTVFNCVYFAVKNALMASGLIYEFQFKNEAKRSVDYKSEPFVPESYDQPKIKEAAEKEETVFKTVSNSEYEAPGGSSLEYEPKKHDEVIQFASISTAYAVENAAPPVIIDETSLPHERSVPYSGGFEGFSYLNSDAFKKKEIIPENPADKEEREQIIVIGEFFKNYIAAQAGDKIVLIDKHAAHERVIFERLRSRADSSESQLLISGAEILLAETEYSAMLENSKTLADMGFGIDFSNEPFIRVNAVPILLEALNMDEVIPEIAENFLLNKRDPQTHKLDDMLHELACKAAIKANDKNDIKELQKLAETVFYDENIRHCPHGRPVMFVMSRRELEKQFKRIV
ncbi:MAG: DNA mismatch repair endonuclease MutL [Clostridium sp.]|nr:DNA mismatch repair endonuclease MutL [Clostridium sp.]MCM1547589.1 DNA mismatch repair endonuclease MutL [Ruminococcus sp.]